METHFNIGMGEWKVRPAPGILTCMGLGSCVGVVLYDAITRIGGVAHVMMPEGSRESWVVSRDQKTHDSRLTTHDFPSQPAKFADSAIRLMVERMVRLGSSTRNIKARLFGGANMFPDVIQDEFLDIGKRNIRVIKEELKTLDIRLVAEDTRGHVGRGIVFDLVSGEVLIKRFDEE